MATEYTWPPKKEEAEKSRRRKPKDTGRNEINLDRIRKILVPPAKIWSNSEKISPMLDAKKSYRSNPNAEKLASFILSMLMILDKVEHMLMIWKQGIA